MVSGGWAEPSYTDNEIFMTWYAQMGGPWSDVLINVSQTTYKNTGPAKVEPGVLSATL